MSGSHNRLRQNDALISQEFHPWHRSASPFSSAAFARIRTTRSWPSRWRISLRPKTEIAAAQGLLFVTPEYNRSIPGVLKNAIDHASRPYGQSAWAGKPAGVVGVSVGAIGTALAQQHLRNILAYLDVPTLGAPEVFLQAKEDLFDDKGHIGNEGTKKFLQGWMDKYVAWVKNHSA